MEVRVVWQSEILCAVSCYLLFPLLPDFEGGCMHMYVCEVNYS